METQGNAGVISRFFLQAPCSATFFEFECSSSALPELGKYKKSYFIKIARHDMCMCQAATLCNLMQTLLGPKRRRGH